MERFIVALLFFSVTSCQSLINEEIIFEEVQKPDEIQDIIEIENEIEPELVWDHLKKNAKNRKSATNGQQKGRAPLLMRPFLQIIILFAKFTQKWTS